MPALPAKIRSSVPLSMSLPSIPTTEMSILSPLVAPALKLVKLIKPDTVPFIMTWSFTPFSEPNVMLVAVVAPFAVVMLVTPPEPVVIVAVEPTAAALTVSSPPSALASIVVVVVLVMVPRFTLPVPDAVTDIVAAVRASTVVAVPPAETVRSIAPNWLSTVPMLAVDDVPVVNEMVAVKSVVLSVIVSRWIVCPSPKSRVAPPAALSVMVSKNSPSAPFDAAPKSAPVETVRFATDAARVKLVIAPMSATEPTVTVALAVEVLAVMDVKAPVPVTLPVASV